MHFSIEKNLQNLEKVALTAETIETSSEIKNQEEKNEAVARRKITRQIKKNEGLKRYRSKKFKHSRTRTREKWRKMQIKVKGVRKEFKALEGHYLGEKTGINANVVRSIRL